MKQDKNVLGLPALPDLNPTTASVIYSDEESKFLVAISTYKRTRNRPFPTWPEVFRVLISLGYRKVSDPLTEKELNETRETTSCWHPRTKKRKRSSK
jgi:hypothetical protein